MTKTKVNILKALRDTGRTFFVSDEVAKAAPTEPTGEIEFFILGKYVTCLELEVEYANRGLVPATLQSLVEFDGKNQDVMDEKRYVGIQWKDADGKYCYATFNRWGGGGRHVLVRRLVREWHGYWWFAGLRKSGTFDLNLGSKQHLDTLNLDLVSRVKSLESDMEKIKKFLII